jgi:hypothetical protein
MLFPLHKTEKSHRMKQLYSYDVRDSETFTNTFMVEQRIQAEVEELKRSKINSEY